MSQETIKATQSMGDENRSRPVAPFETPTVEISTVLASSCSSSQVNASASALLLNDLGMPATQDGSPPQAGAGTNPVPVKRERSPSPALDGTRLITQGCVRIAPLPPNCRKPHSGYLAARQELAKAEMDKLRKLKLQPTRVFTREDGMVIDWKSCVPVLSDTLLPPTTEQSEGESVTRPERDRDALRTGATQRSREQEDHPTAEVRDEAMVQDYLFPARSNVREGSVSVPQPAGPNADIHDHQRTSHPPPRESSGGERKANTHLANQSAMLMDVIDLTKDDDGITPAVPELLSEAGPHAAPSPPLAYQTSTTHSDTARSSVPASSQESALPNGSVSRPNPHFIVAPSPSASNRVSLPRTVSISSDNSDLDEMETAALDFLKKYMIAFSEDRAILVRAYSRMATLSIITPSDRDAAGIPSAGIRRVPYQGRADIVSALLALPDEQRLYDEDGEGVAEVDWDLVYVEDAGDVLLICYATHDRSLGSKTDGQGKGKGKGRQSAERWAYEQRFLLRRREWDEEDRDTPGLWPLIAVSHQMTIKPLLGP
ncbi:hypothetical protein C8T65DRAFT_737603 [Cerioporus squamosus]|nr:hypothetical protein C8T65DRAFT_737603 [Cerioporus squamosus]